MLLPVPEAIIQNIEKMISQFMWKGRNRINRNCLINSVENGGLNLVDVQSKIKSLEAGWVNRWLNEPQRAPIAESFLTNIGGSLQLFLKMNVHAVKDLQA